jgi:hypothetical protein
MRKIWLLSVTPLALLTSSIGTQAADLVPVLNAPPPAPITEWSIEGGMRYWYSERPLSEGSARSVHHQQAQFPAEL